MPDIDPQTVTVRDLKLTKQRLVAAYDLTGEIPASSGTPPTTRSEMLKLLDELQDATLLDHHRFVARHPGLQLFLHNHAIPAEESLIIGEPIKPELLQWISPYFAHAFRTGAGNAFRKMDEAHFVRIVSATRLMTKEDEWYAWEPVEEHLSILADNLYKILKNTIHTPAYAGIYTDASVLRMLTYLPAQRFTRLLDIYAINVLNLAVREFNNRNLDWAVSAVAALQKIAVSDEVLKAVVSSEHEMLQILEKAYGRKPTRDFPVQLIIPLIVALSMLLGLCTK